MHKKRASISGRHAQRERWSRRANARCRFRLAAFLDLNSAARAGHRDELLAGVADEFAPGAARRLVECMQAGPACRARWARQTRRSRRADAAARTVRTARARWPRRPRQALPSCVPLRSLRARRPRGSRRSGRPRGSRRSLCFFGAWRSLIGSLALRSRRTRAKQKSAEKNCTYGWLAHRFDRS
jgi:hypothetical protein